MFLLILFASAVSDDAAALELARLQGEWTPLRLERKGEFIDDCFRHTSGIVIDKDIIRFRVEERTLIEFRCKLDPTRSPKAVDLTATCGPRKGAVLRGIYTLNGDHLTLCWPIDDDQPRPRLLLDAPDRDHVTLMLQRRR
jgi:uncharacterized protein (TIGR03067 family)